MKKTILALVLSIVGASAQEFVELPLLSAPLVLTNITSGVTITPTSAGASTNYYYNVRAERNVQQNSKYWLSNGVWETTASLPANYPSPLSGGTMWAQKTDIYPVLSLVTSSVDAEPTNTVAVTLLRSYDGVNYESLTQFAQGTAVPLTVTYTIKGATTHTIGVHLTNGLAGVKAIKVGQIRFAKSSGNSISNSVVIADLRLTGVRN